MAEYRSGNEAAAVQTLVAAADANKNNAWVSGTSAFFQAMSLFRQGKPDEARKLAIAAAAKMKPLPADEQNPLTGNANDDDLNDLILWLAYKEAKAMIQFDAAPAPRNTRREMTASWGSDPLLASRRHRHLPKKRPASGKCPQPRADGRRPKN